MVCYASGATAGRTAAHARDAVGCSPSLLALPGVSRCAKRVGRPARPSAANVVETPRWPIAASPGRCAAAATARRNGPGVGAVDAVGYERLPLPPRRIGLTCVSAAATARSEPVRLAGATVPAGSTPTASPYASCAGGGPIKRVPDASELSPSRRSGRWARSVSAATSASGSTRHLVAGVETSGSSSATTRTKVGSAAPVSGSTCSQAAAHARARPALTKTVAARDAS